MTLHWRHALLAVPALTLAACAIEPEPDFFASPDIEGGVDFGPYVSGRFADGTGDARAPDFLLRAARQDPANPMILSRAFLALLTMGRMQEAVSVAQELHARRASHSLADLVLALDAFRHRRFDEALSYQEGLSSSGFETLIAPVLHAWVEAARGNRDAALAALTALDRAAALRPFANAHRAFILDYLEEPDAARNAYEEVLAGTQMSSLQPVVAYASFLQRHGATDEAESLLRQFTQAYGASAFLEQAYDNLLAEEPIESVTSTPEGALSLVLLRAAGELDRGEAYQPAIVYARLAAMLTPDMADAKLRLAGLLADAELYDAALEVLTEIARDSPEYATARAQIAWVYQQSGEPEAAVGALEEYLQARPEDVRTWATLGDIYRTEERWQDAAHAYTRALSLPPSEGEVEPWFLHFTRGIAYERMGEWELAEADLLKSLEYNPDQAQVLNYLGYSWIDRGMNLERGTEMIEHAVELRPDDGFIIDSLGWAYYLRGAYEQAVRHLERAVLLEPTDPTINDHLGDAYWKVGRYLEARFQWSHALSNDPEEEKDRVRIAEKLEYGLELADASGSR